MHTTPFAAAALAAAIATPLAPAHAQTPPAPPSAPASTPVLLDMPQLIERLRGLGYSDIREIERKGERLYEVDARNPAGERVELTIDARSGEILRSKPER